MVHSTFGSNRPAVLAILVAPAIALILGSYFFSGFGGYALGGTASNMLLGWFEEYPVWRRSLGMMLIAGNAILLNVICNKHDFAVSENYYPSLLFLGLAALDFKNIDLQPIMFSNLFVLLAVRRLLTVYRAESALSIGFDSALFLCLAVFFFPPSALLLPLPWLVFLQVRPFGLREWLAPIAAVLAAVLYAFSFFFIAGHPFLVGQFFDWSLTELRFFENPFNLGFLVAAIVVSIVSVLGLVGFFNDIAKSTVRKKNTKYIFLWVFFLLVLSFVYTKLLKADHSGSWLILATPAAVFSSVFFAGRSKRPIIRVVVFYVWLAACLAAMIFGR